MQPSDSGTALSKIRKAAVRVQDRVASNRQTTLVGALTVAFAIAPIWAPPQYQSKLQQTSAVLAGFGLILAQDGKGGT